MRASASATAVAAKRKVHALSGKLTAEFGRGFTRFKLLNRVRCAEAYPDAKILHALRANLSWTHLRRIVYIGDPLKRDFYAEMCRLTRQRLQAKQAGSIEGST